MSNPVWTQRTWYRGGGDSPFVNRRVYKYHFEDQWFHFITRYKHEIRLPFNTVETATQGDTHGHLRVLADPDFTVKDRNVMEWARQSISKGKVDFKFVIDASLDRDIGQGHSFVVPDLVLIARFSDPGTAALFKLAFG